MKYATKQKLPKNVKDSLPKHAQEIYTAAHDSAYEQHKDEEDTESTAHKIAWAAVKQKYEKTSVGNWRRK